MTDFLNGIILVVFGGIKLICYVCEHFAYGLVVAFNFLCFTVAEIFNTISKLCVWITHKQKPESFFDIYKGCKRILDEIRCQNIF